MRAIAGLALALVLSGVVAAQDLPTKTDERRASALADAFADVARKTAASVVAVLSSGGDELGYGVVVDDGTWVLTSRSIVEHLPATPFLQVRTSAGEKLQALAHGRNEAYDVALLKLDCALKLPALPRGASGKLAIGQWVVTVGTSADRPLAVGVVSALGRRVEPRAESQAVDLFGLFSENGGPKRAYLRVIQHDSPIDSEKHGTPVVDADGRLVGINLDNAYRGSAYAAPIDEVSAFLEDLKAGKGGPRLPRPGYIGVVVGSVRSRDLARRLGITGPGIELHEVAPDLPAAKAGLKSGDVILAIDGEKVASMQRFGQVIGATLPGETLKIRIQRDGKELELPVRVGERPPGDE